MAYHLKTEKKIAAIAALCEGASIRAVERMTGIHRDTIMRLGVSVGSACGVYLNTAMRNLELGHIEADELWAFIGKKQAHVNKSDNPDLVGDMYTFVALDKETKLVPSYFVGKRTLGSATRFMWDLSSRMKNRVQLSTDQLPAYVEAVEQGFGTEIDYGQIVKTFSYSELGQRRYSPPEIFSSESKIIMGTPAEKICTSHVEVQNLTVRMHCRRFTRLTNAFSKKLENFKAAVSLHFGYYNLCKRHTTIRMTPAMAAGVETSQWEVADLVALTEAA